MKSPLRRPPSPPHRLARAAAVALAGSAVAETYARRPSLAHLALLFVSEAVGFACACKFVSGQVPWMCRCVEIAWVMYVRLHVGRLVGLVAGHGGWLVCIESCTWLYKLSK